MLTVSTFDTITGNLIEHLPHDNITGEVLVTLATGSETSTAVLEVSLSKEEVAGWRTRFAKVDRSVALWDNEGGTVTVHYAGFIDKVEADGVADGGIHLTLRLSDAAENLKMIKLSEDHTFEAGTWAGVIRAVIEGAFSQPNTPTVAVVGATAGGTGKKLEAKPTGGGASYSSLIEDVKTTSNGGYAEVVFTPVARSSGGSFTGMSWTAEVGAALINLDNTVDVENHQDVYEFTISTDSNSTYSRLTLMNAEGERKVYTNPNGGSVLSDEVMSVDAALADFDSIAAAYMQSDLLASSESHEVHVKMELATVRGIVGGAGVLPKAVEYNWSTSVRLRIVQAEYRIPAREWGTGNKTVPVELTFAPITNKTWVPPSRADSDNMNQDWIDKNKYSGVGRDSFSGAHPGDYGGGPGEGGDGGGGGGETPPELDLPEFPADPDWWSGSEPLEFPELAQGRQKPVYGFELSEPHATRPVSAAAGTTPGLADDFQWWAGRGVATGQSHDGKKVYWSYWSASDSATAFSHRRVSGNGSQNLRSGRYGLDQGVNIPMSSGYQSREYVPLVPQPLNDLKLVICEAELSEGEFVNPRQVSVLSIDADLQKRMTLDMFLVGSQGDFEKLQALGVEEGSIQNSGAARRVLSNVRMAIRGIYTTKDRIVLMYETFVDCDGANPFTINSVRTITVRKQANGDWETTPGANAISNGGGVRFWEEANSPEDSPKGVLGFFDSTFRGGETWFGAMSGRLFWNTGKHVAGMVFNLYQGNSIDPSSYNPIPSLGEVWKGGSVFATRVRPQVTIARGTQNQGMSLYASGYYDTAGPWHKSFEFELANGRLSGKTRFQAWKPAAMYPDVRPGAETLGVDYVPLQGNSSERALTVHGIPLVVGAREKTTSTETAQVGIMYTTGIIPLKDGEGVLTPAGSTMDNSRRSVAYDSIEFTRSDAGVPTITGYNPAQESIRRGLYSSGTYYHDGYLYTMVFTAGFSPLSSTWASTMSAPGVEDYPFWWYSAKMTSRSTAKPIETGDANWYTLYNDIPLNPAGRDQRVLAEPPRYPTEELGA